MAQTQTAWRCSQCGTLNEPGARACSGCGKWPSLFDLQNTVDDAPAVADEMDVPATATELFEPETLEPETFEPETFEPEAFEQTYEDGMPEPEEFEPEEEDEESDNRSRVRRWIISAIWIIGIIVWFVANTFGDR